MKLYRKMILVCVMAVLTISLAAGAASAKTWKMTVAAGHPPIFVFISAIHDFFIPYVNEHLAPLGHKIEWKEAYGGTVTKIGSELEAIQTGAVEMVAMGTVFEAAKMPLHNVSYYTPFGSGDINIVLDAFTALQRTIPEVAAEWTRHGMVNLGGNALDTYHIFAKEPIESVDDVKGRKLAAAGPSANWLKGTGGVPVSANLPEHYNGVQLGVFDGSMIFGTGAIGIKLYEVAPHVAMVNFGAQYAGGISINKKFFDAFPSEVQKVFIDAGKFYTLKYGEVQSAKAKGAFDAMEKAGAKMIPFSDAQRAAWAKKMPNVPMEWAATMEAKGLPGKKVVKGYLDGLRERGVKVVRDWDKE